MIKIKFLFIFMVIFLLSCNKREDNTFKFTYTVTSEPEEFTELLVVCIDHEGNFITQNVESGWTLDIRVPDGSLPAISVGVNVKDEYAEKIAYEDCRCTAQISQNGKILKEGTGLTVNISLP